MKTNFNFVIGNANITIDGQPVQVEDIKIGAECEYSVQELATGATLIKDLVNQFKDIFKDKISTATQVATTKAETKEEFPAGTFDDRAIVKKEIKVEPTPIDRLFEDFEELLDKIGCGKYTFRNNGYGKISVGISEPVKASNKSNEAAKFTELFEVELRTGKLVVSFDDNKGGKFGVFIYEDRIHLFDMAPQYIKKALTDNEIPAWVNQWANEVCKGREIM